MNYWSNIIIQNFCRCPVLGEQLPRLPQATLLKSWFLTTRRPAHDVGVTYVTYLIYLVGHPNHEDDRGWPCGSSDTAGVHKKPISVDCNFCSCALKALTEVTFSTLAGSLFHLLSDKCKNRVKSPSNADTPQCHLR